MHLHDQEPNKVEGMLVDLPKGDEEISLHLEAFRHMKCKTRNIKKCNFELWWLVKEM